MTPRKGLLRAICVALNDCTNPDGDPDWHTEDAIAVLNAILVTLPTLGFKIVPVEATDRMLANIGIVHNNTPYCEIYDAILAAAPDVLGEGK
jgi:PleD family two-component response regulator